VAGRLIPELTALGERFAAEDLARLDDRGLAQALDERREALETWRKIYWDEFIPFAHGVRRLALYYNDAVRPEDPYEFVGLLANQDMIALQRNRALAALAAALAENDALREEIGRTADADPASLPWPQRRERIASLAGGPAWLDAFDESRERYLDVTFSRERLQDSVQPLLRHVLALASRPPDVRAGDEPENARALEVRLLDAVGHQREAEAREVMETGRVSWRLRDDDNLLLGRVESQLLRAVDEAEARLLRARRLSGERGPIDAAAAELARGLRNPDSRVNLSGSPAPAPAGARPGSSLPAGERPRQLIGQPAAPGVATGRVRRVRAPADLGAFCPGEILVCDAIQPGFTHVVPLAGAVVERRGGMLIHGAIIAREMGIPCVNGVKNAVDLLVDGELVTVDGHVGIVTVGPPEFDLELGR
jgi:pyruvate,water dikinase